MTFRRLLKYWFYNSLPGFAGRFPYYRTTVYFPPGAQVFRAICELGSFEPDVVDWLTRLARPETTVFDVGANIGLMAIPVLRSCPGCRVASFEPSPSSLPYLRRTAGGSEFGERWLVMGKALSHTAGERDFTVGSPEDALYEGFKSAARIPGARTVRIPVSTLDAEWTALGRPPVSVVKIDVEGAEGEVLEGAAELLAQARPALLLEWYEPYLAAYGTDSASLLTLASTLDYQAFTVPAGVHVGDPLTLRVQMMACQNFLLLPRERA